MAYVICQFSHGPDDVDAPTVPSAPALWFWDAQDLVAHLQHIGIASPAASDMDVEDVIHQVNNVNGGELLIAVI